MLKSILSSIAAVACGAAVAQPVTPQMFGALPTVSEAAISPDGSTVVLLQSLEGVRSLSFYPLDAGQPTSVRLGDVKARAVAWANDDTALLLVSSADAFDTSAGLKTFERFRWAAISRSNPKPRWMLSRNPAFSNYTSPGVLYSVTPDEPETVAIGHRALGGLSVFKVKLSDGAETKLYDGDPETVQWVLDSSGKALLRVDYTSRDEKRGFYAPDADGKAFKLAQLLDEPVSDEALLIPHAQADSARRFYVTSTTEDLRNLRIFDLDSGNREPIFTPSGYDLDATVIDAHTDKLVGATWIDDMPRSRYFDQELESLRDRLQKAMPDGVVSLDSWSRDRKRFLVRVRYADHPDQFFLHDRNAKTLKKLVTSYQALDGKVFAKKEAFQFNASDGLRVPGYLTVPKGASRKNMPLVVLPHGGPSARDDMTFDWWPFFYAARGYLVYQPNFRGSDGYGRKFESAGFGEWGRRMQADITEGVQKLIADGIVDAKRICIVGASYGGYAALAGATLTPDVYACAISIAGVSNIPLMISYQTDQGAVPEDAWDVRIGARIKDAEELKAVSPMYLADRAKAPILLMHGKDDVVVPVGQSRMMKDALDKARKPTELVLLSREDHWLSSAETRTEMLARSIAFIDKHIGAPK